MALSEVALLFGTPVAETILASVHVRAQPTGRTYGRKRSDQSTAKHLARRGPSTYESRPICEAAQTTVARTSIVEDRPRRRPSVQQGRMTRQHHPTIRQIFTIC